ncbi:hypothetical protein RND81_03G039800 [Saponaria officinalis]|uniref:Retrovirus-related Pol polyprotein from transposon TNT 1-94-like beta-barrel domain-containing protein n=1 Tax=Saponaria officinalis TaxID=3572 RepID=A0AAW1M3Q6_SAPOF
MASASNTLSLPTPIFGGENYDYWCIKIKLFLRANALWKTVENGSQQQTEGAQTTEASLKKISEDELKDAKALSFILNADIFRIFSVLGRQVRDERIRAIRLNTLRKDFENLKMGENKDIETYTLRVMEIVNQMKIYGEDITETRIVQKILVTLTKRFDMIVIVIEESRDLSKRTMTELVGSLLAHDQKFKNKESSSEDAFQSMHKSKRPDSKWWKNKSDDGGRYNKQMSQSKGKFPPCGICGKNNHEEKNCYFKGKSQCRYCKKYRHIEKDSHYSSSTNKEHLFYAGQTTTSNNKSRCLIDSGCTNHMTNDSSIFCKLDIFVQTPVRVGNVEIVTSKGKRTIIVPTKRGTEFIKDVLLASDLVENLLSVAQMIKNVYL